MTVTSVRKDPDGSYDVFGTKSGSQVMFDVSADLKTITQNTLGAGRADHARTTPSIPSSSTTRSKIHVPVRLRQAARKSQNH